MLNQALFVSLACYLMLPAADTFKAVLLNSAGAMLVFFLLSRLPFTVAVPVTVLLQPGIIVFCLGMLLWSLTQLFEHLFPHSNSIRISVTLLAVIITSAPLWVGPLAEIYRAGDVIVNGVVSVTPLTHFSVAADYDYLRAEWMYQHSAFGSLPFAYPGFISITACYFLFVFILRIILWGARRHPR
jgi:hypothetical protein